MRPVALAVVLAVLVPVLGAQEEPSLEVRVGRLVADLGSPDFDVRDRATRALVELGEPAIPMLERALDHHDPEIANRVQDILERIPRRIELFGSRSPERRAALAKEHGAEASLAAVERALGWFARHQDLETGRWDASDFTERCEGDRCSGSGAEWTDVGQTGLALLAFLGAGQTHREGAHAKTVARGLDFLVGAQDGEGCFGERRGHFTYNHAIATLAVVEAFGMSRDDGLREPARRAVAFLVAAQNPGAGWRYKVRSGDSDTSITSWALHALVCARAVGLEVPRASIDGGRAWIESVTDPQYHRTGYIQKGDMGARLASQIGKFAPAETNTAISLLARLELGADRGDAVVRGQAELLRVSPPAWEPKGGPGGTSRIDAYYWYYGALATWQFGGHPWKVWNEATRNALVPNQRAEGEAAGSWDPVDAWGSESGRLGTTALAVLTLETCYRYPRFER